MKRVVLLSLLIAVLALLAFGCSKKTEIEEPAEEAEAEAEAVAPVSPPPAPAAPAAETHAPSMDDVSGAQVPRDGTKPTIKKVEGVEVDTQTGAKTPTRKVPAKATSAPATKDK